MSFSSQGAVEAVNKTIQRPLSAAFDNIVGENNNLGLRIESLEFMHFHNCCMKDATLKRNNHIDGQL